MFGRLSNYFFPPHFPENHNNGNGSEAPARGSVKKTDPDPSAQVQRSGRKRHADPHSMQYGAKKKVRKESSPINYLQSKKEKLMKDGRPFKLEEGNKLISYNRPWSSWLWSLPGRLWTQVQSLHSPNEPPINRPPSLLIYHSKGKCISTGHVLRCPPPDDDEPSSKKIECRHLSYSYATGIFGHRGVGGFTAIDSREKLAKHQGICSDKTWHTFRQAIAAEAIYFDRQGFHEALCGIGSELKDGDNKRYLLLTSTHAMVLGFKKSKRKGIVVYFYDPRDTCRHEKIIATLSDSLKLVTLNDLVIDDIWEYYFHTGEEILVLLSPNTKPERDGCEVKYFVKQPSLGLARALAQWGHYGHHSLEQMSTDMRKKTEWTQNYEASDPSIAFKAIYLGHHDAFIDYVNDVIASPLSKETKITMLIGSGTQPEKEVIIMAMLEALQLSKLDIATVTVIEGQIGSILSLLESVNETV